jgi:hypothetical protein
MGAIADTLEADTLFGTPGNQPLSLGTVCAGQQSSAGSIEVRIKRAGSSPGNVYGDSATIDVSVRQIAGDGLAATDPGNITTPSGWNADSNGTESSGVFSSITLNTTTVGAFNGSVQFEAIGPAQDSSSLTTQSNALAVTATVSNTGACAPPPANTAPTVAFNSGTITSADEGDLVTFNYTITDPDADTWDEVSGFPSCGAGNTVSSVSIVGKTGSFDCTFVDGLVPAQNTPVSIQVTDGTANSNVATTLVAVNNVNPIVGVPAFTVATVDCRVQVTLGNITFGDPGVNDGGTNGWAVVIDWNDPNDTNDTTFNATTQGLQSNHTHTYNSPGTYNATVTVTDKDGGAGSKTTTAALTVTQEYTVTFLQPFDPSTAGQYVINKAKAGRVVPVKVQIYDVCAQAAYVSPSAAPSVTVSRTANPANSTGDPVETYADAGASNGNDQYFRWSTDGFWIYNLDTKALGLVTGNSYRVDAYVGAVKATDDEWGLLATVR